MIELNEQEKLEAWKWRVRKCGSGNHEDLKREFREYLRKLRENSNYSSIGQNSHLFFREQNTKVVNLVNRRLESRRHQKTSRAF